MAGEAIGWWVDHSDHDSHTFTMWRLRLLLSLSTGFSGEKKVIHTLVEYDTFREDESDKAKGLCPCSCRGFDAGGGWPRGWATRPSEGRDATPEWRDLTHE